MDQLIPGAGDALIIVDVQNDFLPGGKLGVAHGDEVVPALNRYIERFASRGLPVFATRDWHPENHCSFSDQGGIWPPHCLADSAGAAFAPGLALPDAAIVVSKADTPAQDAYSGFEGTDLAAQLRARSVKRVYVGGIATDYCVLNTVKDALAEGFEVLLLTDAIRAVDVKPGDGDAAIEQMKAWSAQPVSLQRA
jgi:nicotinamidase/pyrazinamidase